MTLAARCQAYSVIWLQASPISPSPGQTDTVGDPTASVFAQPRALQAWDPKIVPLALIYFRPHRHSAIWFSSCHLENLESLCPDPQIVSAHHFEGHKLYSFPVECGLLISKVTFQPSLFIVEARSSNCVCLTSTIPFIYCLTKHTKCSVMKQPPFYYMCGFPEESEKGIKGWLVPAPHCLGLSWKDLNGWS